MGAGGRGGGNLWSIGFRDPTAPDREKSQVLKIGGLDGRRAIPGFELSQVLNFYETRSLWRKQ